MKDQLDSSFAENPVKKSKSGKGLDTAAFVIGLIGFVWSCVPYVGAAALVITTTGVILGIVALSRSKKIGDTKTGLSVTALVLNIISIVISVFWIYKIVVKVMDTMPAIEEAAKSVQDTAALRKTIEEALRQVDSTAH